MGTSESDYWSEFSRIYLSDKCFFCFRNIWPMEAYKARGGKITISTQGNNKKHKYYCTQVKVVSKNWENFPSSTTLISRLLDTLSASVDVISFLVTVINCYFVFTGGFGCVKQVCSLWQDCLPARESWAWRKDLPCELLQVPAVPV